MGAAMIGPMYCGKTVLNMAAMGFICASLLFRAMALRSEAFVSLYKSLLYNLNAHGIQHHFPETYRVETE